MTISLLFGTDLTKALISDCIVVVLFAKNTDKMKIRRACIASAMRIISGGEKADMSYLSMLSAL
jgi:hypothetical protein